jgi:DNA polymerase-3 subunit gamma/tau
LKKICQGESVEISDTSLHIIAQSAAGSLRDAESLLEKVVSFSGETIDETEILPLLGLANPELLNNLIKGILGKDMELCFTSFDAIYNSGADLLQFYAQLRDKFRVLLMTKTLKKPDIPLETMGDEPADLNEMIHDVSGDELYSYLRILVDAETDMRQSLNPRLTLELMFYRMVHISKIQDISDLIKTVQELKHEMKTGSTFSGGFSPSAAVQPKTKGMFNSVNNSAPAVHQTTGHEPEQNIQSDIPPPLEQDDDPKNRLINTMSNKNQVLSAYLEVAEFFSPDQNQCTLSFPASNRFAYEKVMEDNNLALLNKVVKSEYGNDVELKITIKDQDVEATEPSDTEPSKKDERVKKALQNPIVKKTIDLFDGEITDIE